MESARAKVTLQFGTFLVVASTPSIITIEVAKESFFHLHVTSVPHTVKVGDRLPLYTRVPYGKPSN